MCVLRELEVPRRLQLTRLLRNEKASVRSELNIRRTRRQVSHVKRFCKTTWQRGTKTMSIFQAGESATTRAGRRCGRVYRGKCDGVCRKRQWPVGHDCLERDYLLLGVVISVFQRRLVLSKSVCRDTAEWPTASCKYARPRARLSHAAVADSHLPSLVFEHRL